MLYAIVVVLVLIIDQLVKIWSISNLAGQGVKEFIPGFIQLRYVENSGAAFGLFSDMNFRWGFVAITLVFAVIVVIAIRKNWISGRLGHFLAALIMGGALGNMIDRIIYTGGYVVDTFEFVFTIFGKPFPVFNVADIFLVVGGILFCLYIIFHKEDESEPQTVSGRGGSLVTNPAPRRRASAADDSDVLPESPEEHRPRIAKAPAGERLASREVPSRASQAAPRRPVRRAPQSSTAAQPQEAYDSPFYEPEEKPKSAPPQRPATQRPAPQRPTSRPAADSSAPQRPASRPVADSPAPQRPAAPAPKPQSKPVTSESFDLDDILAEFKD